MAAAVTLTVIDDEGTPTATLVLTPGSIDESGASNASTVTAMLSRPSSAAVTLTVSVPENSPVTQSGATLSIAAGATTSTGTVTLTAVDNDTDAPNATVAVSATATGGGVAAPAAVTLTVIDDEGTPTATLVLTPGSIDESGASNASTVTAMLSRPSSAAVTLTVSVPENSPVTQSGATLSIAAGATTSTGTVTLTAVDNDTDAPNATVAVSATATGGGVAAPAAVTLTVIDDEGTPTATLVLTPGSIDESGASNASTVTAMLSRPSSAAVTLTVSVPENSPVTQSGATLSIAAGATTSTGTVTLTAVDNDTDAPNATVAVSATATGGGVAAPAAVTLTVIDDEGTPTATLVLTPGSIDESGASNASTVTAMLSRPSSAAVTLTVSVPENSPVTQSGATLSIAAGATTSTGTVTLTAVDNDTDAPNATVAVSATATGGGVAAPAAVTLTVIDDEGTPTATLVLTPGSIDESGASNASTVTATLSRPSSAAVTLTVSVPENSPVTQSGATLSIAAGATTSTGTVTLTAVDNDTDAPNATVAVSATATGGGVAAPAAVTLTVIDDEGTPTATLVLTPGSIDESGASNASTVTAMLSRPSSAAVTLTVSVPENSPVTQSGATLSIAAGATTSTGTVTLTAVDNDTDAPNATVAVSATATGGGVAAPAAVTLTVIDDEGTPTATLVLTPGSIDESGASNASTVTAMLSRPSSAAVTLTVSVPENSPVTQSGATLSIAAGATTSTGTVTLTAVDNDTDAPNATVAVSATATGGGVAAPAAVTLTVIDDEGTPNATLVLTPGSIDESGASNASTVTAMLSRPSSAAVTLTVSVPENSPVTQSGATLSIAAGATTSTGTVTLTAVDNDTDAPNATVAVSATATGGGVAAPAAVTLTVIDDEGTPTATLVLTPGSIDESGASNASTVTAMLSRPSSAAVTLTVSVPENSPVTQSGATLSIAAGATTSTGTVTLTAVDNDTDAPNATVAVSATATGGGVAAPAAVTLTVIDDEGTPTATLVLTPGSIDESGASNASTVTAMLSRPSSAAVTLTVSVPENSPVTQSGATLSIAAGATTSTGTVTLTAVDNDTDAPNATVAVSATATGGGVAAPAAVTLTVIDDEGTPTATLVLTPGSIDESGASNASTVTAMLSRPSSAAVTLTVSVPENSPVTQSGATLSIAAGATTSTGTVTLTAVDNDTDAPNATVAVSATATGGGVAAPAAVTLTVIDDEGTPTATLVLTPGSIDESGASNASTVTAMLSRPSSAAVTLTVSVPENSPVTQSGATLSIAAGATTSTGTVTLTAVDNDTDAPNATVAVSATATGGGVAAPAAVTLTVIDDEGTPTATLVLTPGSIDESGASNASTVTAMLSRPSSAAVTLTVSVPENSPVTQSGATLSIAAGATTSTGTVTLTAVDNDTDAPNATVAVSATATGGGVAAPAAVTLTVVDDDDDTAPTALTLAVDADTGANGVQDRLAEDGGAKTTRVTATLSGATRFSVAKTVTVQIGKTGDSAVEGTDYQAIADLSLTLPIGAASVSATFPLTPINDALFETEEAFSISGVLAEATVTGTSITITDDEEAPTVSLALDPASIDESGDANTSTVTATLSGPASETVTLTVAAATVAPATTEDFTLSENTTLAIAAGTTASTGTVTLTAVDNDTDAPDKTVTVSATARGGHGAANPADISLTLADDDVTPEKMILSVDTDTRIEGSQSTVAENDGTRTVRITASLDGATRFSVDQTVTVEVGQATDSATEAAVGPATGGFVTPLFANTRNGGAPGEVDGDYLMVPDFELTIPAGEASGSATFVLMPTDDVLAEGDETISVNGLLTDVEVTVTNITIQDDDAAPTALTLSVDADTAMQGVQDSVQEDGGAKTVQVTATLASATRFTEEKPVAVAVGKESDSAVEGTDYAAVAGLNITIPPGTASGSTTFTLTPVDDILDEENETISVDGTMAGLTVDGTAITIEGGNDPMPKAWLIRFGRMFAEQALDGITERIQADRAPGLSGSFAGQAFGSSTPVDEVGNGSVPAVSPGRFAPRDASRPHAFGNGANGFGDAFGHGDERHGSLETTRTMTPRGILAGSNFAWTTKTDGRGGTFALWGRGAHSTFDSRDAGVRLDGEASTGMLGADYSRGRWLVGLALAKSEGEGDFDSLGIGEDDGPEAPPLSGKMEASLTAAIPYAVWHASGQLKVWGTAGHGTGDLTLVESGKEPVETDIDWNMAAAGVRGEFLTPAEGGDGPGLAAVSDALWVRTSSDRIPSPQARSAIAASEADVTRLRLGLEGSYRMALEGGGMLMPRLEVGMRHDGGDAETGFGMELGGGLAWADPRLGLSLDLSGRALLTHEDGDLNDRGISASLILDPDPASERGPSLNLRQDLGGQATGGLDALFAPDPISDRAGSESTGRWAVEGAYGFPAFGGRFTGSPHAAYELSGTTRDYTLGWRLAPVTPHAPELLFDVKAMRSEGDAVAPEHSVGFEIRTRW